MKRTTVFLQDRLLKEAQRAAEREGISFAQLVREAVARYLAGPRAEGPHGIPAIAGQFGSGQADTSERVDELLWQDPHA